MAYNDCLSFFCLNINGNGGKTPWCPTAIIADGEVSDVLFISAATSERSFDGFATLIGTDHE